MMFTSDYFSSFDRSTPEEPISQTLRYRQEMEATPDRSSNQSQDQSLGFQKMQQSLEPPKHRTKRRKPLGRRTRPARTPEPNSRFNNEYSPIISLGFTLIKFLFLLVVGLIIAYIFTSLVSEVTAALLWNIGSMLIIPLVGLVFCIVAIVIILESCR